MLDTTFNVYDFFFKVKIPKTIHALKSGQASNWNNLSFHLVKNMLEILQFLFLMVNNSKVFNLTIKLISEKFTH